MDIILWQVSKTISKIRSVKILDNAETNWNERFYEPGQFQVSVPADKEILSVLQKQCFLTKTTSESSDIFDSVMIVEKVIMSESETDGQILTLSGRSADAILSYRTCVDIVKSSGGYRLYPFRFETTIPDSIEFIFRAVFTEAQYTQRNVPWLGIAQNIHSENLPVIPVDLFGENFLTVLNKWRKSYKIGLRSELVRAYFYEDEESPDPDDWILEFEIYEPTDHTSNDRILISQKNGDIEESEYNYNKNKEVSAVIVLGTTDPEDPTEEFCKFVENEKGIYRKETYMDLTSINSEELTTPIEDVVENEARASLQLPEQKMSIIETQNSHYHVGKDYHLGDLVIVRDGFGNYGKVRCTQVTETYDRNGHHKIPTFDEWETIPTIFRCKNGVRFMTRDQKQIIVRGE